MAERDEREILDFMSDTAEVPFVPVFKINNEDMDVEFDVLLPDVVLPEADPRRRLISEAIHELDGKVEDIYGKTVKLDREIECLTNRVDGIDYIVAIVSGALAGVIDSLWVGEFDLSRGTEWSNNTINERIMEYARKYGYRGHDGINGAKRFLERKSREANEMPSDNIYLGRIKNVYPKNHHLADLAHHYSYIGLIYFIHMHLTNQACFSNSNGELIRIDTISGELIDKDVPKQLFKAIINWMFHPKYWKQLWESHLISDMAGSSKGVGMGIPGPFLSRLQRASTLPLIKNTDLPKLVNDIFEKYQFDYRKEMAVRHETRGLFGRQVLTVIFIEVIVRVFYFVDRLFDECKEKGDLTNIDWRRCLPWKNRTIVRMLTIAYGTFIAIDQADAMIRSKLKEGIVFGKTYLLRVNYVGVARFTLAVFSDIKMGIGRERNRDKRMVLYSELIHLLNAKTFYHQANIWIAIDDTECVINNIENALEQGIKSFVESTQCIDSDLNQISHHLKLMKKKYPELAGSFKKALKFGRHCGKG